jgi:hypothetical protein
MQYIRSPIRDTAKPLRLPVHPAGGDSDKPGGIPQGDAQGGTPPVPAVLFPRRRASARVASSSGADLCALADDLRVRRRGSLRRSLLELVRTRNSVSDCGGASDGRLDDVTLRESRLRRCGSTAISAAHAPLSRGVPCPAPPRAPPSLSDWMAICLHSNSNSNIGFSA